MKKSHLCSCQKQHLHLQVLALLLRPANVAVVVAARLPLVTQHQLPLEVRHYHLVIGIVGHSKISLSFRPSNVLKYARQRTAGRDCPWQLSLVQLAIRLSPLSVNAQYSAYGALCSGLALSPLRDVVHQRFGAISFCRL